MTGDLYLDLAISFGGIALLVALSWLLGGWRSIAVTEAIASERLKFDEPDFRAGSWMIGADAKSAAVASHDGAETAVVFSVGDGLATRRFRRGAVGLERDGTAIVFNLNEPSKPRMRLRAPDDLRAEEWLLKLAGPQL